MPDHVLIVAFQSPVPPQGLNWLIRGSEPVAAGIFAAERGPFTDGAARASPTARCTRIG